MGTDVIGTSSYLTGMAPPFDADKDEGHYYAMDVEPWEGASVRIRRDGQWADWADLVDNGKALFWLGKDEIVADAIEVRDPDGTVTRFSLHIEAGPRPAAVRATAKRAVGKGSK